MYLPSAYLLLDACCILNFCASGHFLDILASIPARCVISQVVKDKELLTLQRLEAEFIAGTYQFKTALENGLLLLTDFETESEEVDFINYAFELGDDGESATFAIAAHRHWAVATDDRKAISFAQREIPNIQILSTLEIVKYWSGKPGVAALDLKNALKQIRQIGKYIPRRSDPLFPWWFDAIQE